jgi:methionyl-tRNA formyltransferase
LVTGVTTMRIDSGLDTGDMLLAQVCPVGLEETAVEVYECLAAAGAELMVKTLDGLECGEIFAQAQDHSMATLAPILRREDGWMDFSRTAKEIYDRWRGFQPWPGAHTTLRGKKLIAHRMKVVGGLSHHGQTVVDVEPGALIVGEDVLCVGCAGGTAVELVEVQMEGKKRMGAAEFLRGVQVKSGERLGL